MNFRLVSSFILHPYSSMSPELGLQVYGFFGCGGQRLGGGSSGGGGRRGRQSCC